ncbi:MAG: selenide, water dikinase SelD [Planctomycetes bacterium]|nr:selenide, water dikinase SelD [Planctomycetota bacterium]
MAAIAQVVQALPESRDPNLLIGADHFSDAGVYRLADGLAVVQTVDFFAPLVDDAFLYGQIAAANSMSDVYAMGGRPVTALNVVGFPDEELDLGVLGEILRGGAERAHAAGAVVVGGHSVRDDEIMYGLSVTGVVDPERMMTNRDARPGDALILTKALGTGFITTALRAERCPDDALAAAATGMVALNKVAAEAAVAAGARAATDVTGFGLAGHAMEMARASDVTLVIERGRLPLLPGATALAADGNRTRANATNREHVAPSMRIDAPADEVLDEFLVDPQTSGGLLLAVAPDVAESVVAACRAGGLDDTCVVGSVRDRDDAHLLIT